MRVGAILGFLLLVAAALVPLLLPGQVAASRAACAQIDGFCITLDELGAQVQAIAYGVAGALLLVGSLLWPLWRERIAATTRARWGLALGGAVALAGGAYATAVAARGSRICSNDDCVSWHGPLDVLAGVVFALVALAGAAYAWMGYRSLRRR